MKKILIAHALKSLIEKEKSFLQRADIKLFTAATNDQMLAVHRAEKVNLIITQLDMSGMSNEQFYTTIKNDRELRKVSLIILCPNNPGAKEQAEQCSPHVVMTLPVNTAQLLKHAQHFLNIPWRESYRVLLSVNIEGNSKDAAFFCRSENISTTGLLLETDRDLNERERVRCSFFLPDSKQIIATGEVVRVMKRSEKSGTKQYGVKFDKLTPEDKAAIEVFITKKAHIPGSQSA